MGSLTSFPAPKRRAGLVPGGQQRSLLRLVEAPELLHLPLVLLRGTLGLGEFWSTRRLD